MIWPAWRPEQKLGRWICRLDELSTETQGAASTGCLNADKALSKRRRFSEDDGLQEAHELQVTFRAKIFLAVLGLQEKLLRCLYGTHHRRASHGVTINPNPQVDFPRAIVGLEGLDESKQAVGWPTVQFVKHKSTSFP